MVSPDRSHESHPRSSVSGWDAPVIYLDEYPHVDIGPRGFPYYVCAACTGPLQVLPRLSAAGVMLVCVYNCGQRFWIDDER
jgi:hypothetical protein